MSRIDELVRIYRAAMDGAGELVSIKRSDLLELLDAIDPQQALAPAAPPEPLEEVED